MKNSKVIEKGILKKTFSYLSSENFKNSENFKKMRSFPIFFLRNQKKFYNLKKN